MSTTALALDLPTFEAEEHGSGDDDWIRTELTRRMHTPQGKTPHAQVMAEMDALIARIATQQQTR